MMALIKSDFLHLFAGGFAVAAVAMLALGTLA